MVRGHAEVDVTPSRSPAYWTASTSGCSRHSAERADDFVGIRNGDSTTFSKPSTTGTPAAARCSPARPQPHHGPPLPLGDRHGLESVIGVSKLLIDIVGMQKIFFGQITALPMVAFPGESIHPRATTVAGEVAARRLLAGLCPKVERYGDTVVVRANKVVHVLVSHLGQGAARYYSLL